MGMICHIYPDSCRYACPNVYWYWWFTIGFPTLQKNEKSCQLCLSWALEPSLCWANKVSKHEGISLKIGFHGDAFMTGMHSCLSAPIRKKIHLHSYTHIWIYQGLIEVCVGLQCHPITFRHRPSWAHGWRAARSFQIPGGVSTSSGDRAQPWRPVLACKSKCKVQANNI